MKHFSSPDEFIKDYATRFGSLNKNDFEVLILGYLIRTNYFNKKQGQPLSNYSISVALGIPESKVKRLRYEYALRYSDTDEETLFKSAQELLKTNAQISGDHTKVMLQIEDEMLRQYIIHILKENGKVCDHSFNQEVLVFYSRDILVLLNHLYKGDKIMLEIENQIALLQKQRLTREKILESVVGGLISGAVSGISSSFVSAVLTPGSILESIQTIAKAIL